MGNLHLVTGYGGKVHVTAVDQGSLYAALFGTDSFVLNRGNQFAATVVTNNTIKVADGDIVLQGRHIRMDTGKEVNVTIDNGMTGYNRNDLITVRYTKSIDTGVEEADLVVIKGTAVTGTASDPTYNTGNVVGGEAQICDMPLYRVPLSGLNVGELVPLFSVFGTIPAQVQAAYNAANVAQNAASGAATTAANAQNAANTANTSITSHTGNKSNPHGVTKAQVGLGNVNNNSITMSASGTTLNITFS